MNPKIILNPKMVFPSENLKKRTGTITTIVVHTTGGEWRAETTFKTLSSRKTKGNPAGLSIDFIIDREGRIYQCNRDIEKYYTQHAGLANKSSIGIEVACYLFRDSEGDIPRPGLDRERRLETISGWRQKRIAQLYPVQEKALHELLEYLCDRFLVDTKVCIANKVLADIPKGVCGHFHISRTKRDPGLHTMQNIKHYFDGRKTEIAAKKAPEGALIPVGQTKGEAFLFFLRWLLSLFSKKTGC